MKFSVRKLLLVVSLFGMSSLPAWPWGGEGHRTVGAIADLLLENTPTAKKIDKILEEESLSEVSVWADCAKGFRYCQRPLSDEEKAYAQDNPRHHSYHYTDVPIQQPNYRVGTAGTGKDDVVQVLKQAINVLRGRASNQGPAVLNQKDALWLLVHLVGDIHQPLHVGSVYFDAECEGIVDPNVVGAGQPNFGIGSTVASTTGGNDLKIGSKALHSYWDSGTVTGAMRLLGIRNKSIEDFAKAIAENPPRGWEKSGDPETWPEQWATEILPLARSAIERVEIGEAVRDEEHEQGPKCTWPVTLGSGYTQWANQQALAQLGKAGFRLAALLRAIFEGQ